MSPTIDSSIKHALHDLPAPEPESPLRPQKPHRFSTLCVTVENPSQKELYGSSVPIDQTSHPGHLTIHAVAIPHAAALNITLPKFPQPFMLSPLLQGWDGSSWLSRSQAGDKVIAGSDLYGGTSYEVNHHALWHIEHNLHLTSYFQYITWDVLQLDPSLSSIVLPISVPTNGSSFTTHLMFTRHPSDDLTVCLGQDWMALRDEYLQRCNLVALPQPRPDKPQNAPAFVYDTVQDPLVCQQLDGRGRAALGLDHSMSYINEHTQYKAELFVEILKLLAAEHANPLVLSHLEAIVHVHGVNSCNSSETSLVLVTHLQNSACALCLNQACRDMAGNFHVDDLRLLVHRAMLSETEMNKTLQTPITAIQDPFQFAYTDFSMIDRKNLDLIAASHGLNTFQLRKREDISNEILSHLVSGSCFSTKANGDLCSSSRSILHSDGILDVNNRNEIQANIIRRVVPRLSMKMSRKLLAVFSLDYLSTDSLSQNHKRLRKYAKILLRGKSSPSTMTPHSNISAPQELISKTFGVHLSPESKSTLVQLFRQKTLSQALNKTVCASCGELHLTSESKKVDSKEVMMQIFTRPDIGWNKSPDGAFPKREAVYDWLDDSLIKLSFPLDNSAYKGMEDLILEPHSISDISANGVVLNLCKGCYSSVVRKTLPATALANMNMLGDIPPELSDLTCVEEAMIARC
ncbi:hypothetical protein DL96DRAFT_1722849 [Flagelloscypha sp. PMI_526]|nr:hypothetical protein DL96DRAFT_1722849 [Flagelloscypha sp. PMI_526]